MDLMLIKNLYTLQFLCKVTHFNYTMRKKRNLSSKTIED